MTVLLIQVLPQSYKCASASTQRSIAPAEAARLPRCEVGHLLEVNISTAYGTYAYRMG
ncbi:hypothetical protein [Lactococcus sp.]|uniref:hypothetical protein n=1 Tax=Lactococcus sp. TaxID=44273 RepID=UPI002FC68D30